MSYKDFFDREISVNKTIIKFVILSLVLSFLSYVLFDLVPFFIVTIFIALSISCCLVWLELLCMAYSLQEKYGKTINSLNESKSIDRKIKINYKKEKIRNIALFFMDTIGIQFNSYFFGVVSLMIAAALVPASINFYSNKLSNISVIPKELMMSIFLLLELLFLIAAFARGGGARFISIINEEINLKNISLTIVAASLAMPTIIGKTAISTEKTDLMFKLVAFGVVLLLIYFQQKWIEKDQNIDFEMKMVRKFYLVIISLVMYSCCYYQILYAATKSRAEKVELEISSCENPTISGFHLKCKSFRYVYKITDN